ncbi:uncharacterized protein BDR25DRAFT_305840 [Lindgomyces ingoldianus]|uniref:Uncharacterized protein n=1 Tax=Lindgomyces ingoldianus TaxID=673940 RepID=A0ACB6QJG5_9PLEO|nr:uncharacterized protein BDR25DRAFT_305840 [Lindgomyces ingoldianus]KAF2467040.1 hypothetical protein BDR25DRAFT_305840 [Lindgomyces ingoldianus]
MVNSKNVAFKVDKQAPVRGPPPQPFGTVINCRKPGGKRAMSQIEEVRSQQVPLTKISGAFQREQKRKRSVDDGKGEDGAVQSKKSTTSRDSSPTLMAIPALRGANDRIFPTIRPQPKPTKLRRGRALQKEIDLDSWFTILRFSDPAQLLEMRDKIASCYRFLRDNPTLWKHSRRYYYGAGLPDPPSELTEFQYAHLRHGHGCMSCGTQGTRKTYWAFLRRWCKTCLQSKMIKESEALAMFKDANGEDISFVQKCLPSGIFDSWGNFVGVGPAHAHSLKTVYLLSDVQMLVADFVKESRDNRVSWHAEMRTWINNKVKVVEERREFAQKMEHWEDATRTSKSCDYQGKKEARKTFFVEKAAQLTPPISLREMELCPSYRRAVAIPKEPNMTSWLQLKPKLEKEAAELTANGGRFNDSMRSTPSDMTTSTDMF